MGVDWFRQYLVIEFAEEGLDLLTAIREMLDRHRCKAEEEKPEDVVDKGDERQGGEAGDADDGAKDEEQPGVEGGGEGREEAGVVAPAAEGEGGRVTAAAAEEAEEAGAKGGGGGSGEAEQGEEFDIRRSGKDLFERFIKSGCGAECNLPGTIVSKVRRCFLRGLLRCWRVTICRR